MSNRISTDSTTHPCVYREVHILHYGQEDRTDLVFRIHHCMGDGMTLSAVMMDMMDSEDGDEGVPLTARTKKPRKPCGAQTLSYLKFFLHCFVSFWVSLFKLLSVLFYVNDTPTLVNAVEKRAHKLSLGLSRPISVAELKLAGKNITEANRKKNKNQSTTSKVSINDILTSCLGGGIRRYLKKKNCPSIEKKVLRLTSFIIVSTRMVASGGDNQKLIEDFAQNKSDNQFTYVFMPLAADEASPIERVNKSNQIMSYLKKSLEPVIAQFTNELTMQLCGFPAVFWMTNRFQRANTAIMSNLRGPRVPLRVGKYRMTRLFNFVTPMGMAMCCSFFSYAGNVYLAVDTDSGVIPDAQELVDCIVEEYEAVVAKAK